VEIKDISLGVDSPALMLAKKLKEKNNSLYISRVPKGTRDIFIAIADEEFCSDYGMLLKFLIDKVMAEDNKSILEKLEVQDKRIDALETKKQEDSIKTLNGKKIKFNGGKKYE